MARGIYTRTPKNKENLRLSHLGQKAWNKGLKRWWSSPTEFKEGRTPWNKGKEHLKDGRNPNWQGDMVGYSALHDWVIRKLGKAVWCEWCASTINVQWANASHQYKRDLYDWMQLCAKCHKKHDSGENRGAATKLFEQTPFGFGRRLAQ